MYVFRSSIGFQQWSKLAWVPRLTAFAPCIHAPSSSRVKWMAGLKNFAGDDLLARRSRASLHIVLLMIIVFCTAMTYR